MVLKNGIIYDGSGSTPYKADLKIENDRIVSIEKEITGSDESIDCSNLTIAPGFIDIHSHSDWFMGAVDKPEFLTPFLEQGITTHIGGNCGYGSAGFLPQTEHKALLENNLFQAGLQNGINWYSHSEYFNHLEKAGLRGNLAVLAGSGTIRTSVQGHSAEWKNDEALKQYYSLLEESLVQGAAGVSFGMGYSPDIFTKKEQLVETAKLVKKYNKLLTVHIRAFSSVSGAYPIKPFGTAHNILAMKEFLEVAEETGVKLQISHLIFVGKRTWGTYSRAMELLDKYKSRGVDVAFDTYAHNCGATVITGLLPDWFMAKVPEAYHDKKIQLRIKNMIKISFKMLGFDYSDMQLACSNIPDMSDWDGLFLSGIAKKRGMSNFDNYMDLCAKSDGTARMLFHKYSNPEIINELMRHPSAHFMTDSWIEPAGLQNPASFGCFPRFLELSVNKGVIPLESAVRKMSGANADRVGIKDRGYLKPGMFADVTVFSPKEVKDNYGEMPSGIKHVFLNGEWIVNNGKADSSVLSGKVIRLY